MARRRKARSLAPGGVARRSSSTAEAVALKAPSSPTLVHIEALVEGGGQIMIGTLAPIHGVAVAHDGHKTLAMLRRRPSEPIQQLLARLDAAIATAKSSASRVDEINAPASAIRYEL